MHGRRKALQMFALACLGLVFQAEASELPPSPAGTAVKIEIAFFIGAAHLVA
jgi:hypothetical protein